MNMSIQSLFNYLNERRLVAEGEAKAYLKIIEDIQKQIAEEQAKAEAVANEPSP